MNDMCACSLPLLFISLDFQKGRSCPAPQLPCFSLVHAKTIIAVMTFYFRKQIQNHSLT